MKKTVKLHWYDSGVFAIFGGIVLVAATLTTLVYMDKPEHRTLKGVMFILGVTGIFVGAFLPFFLWRIGMVLDPLRMQAKKWWGWRIPFICNVPIFWRRKGLQGLKTVTYFRSRESASRASAGSPAFPRRGMGHIYSVGISLEGGDSLEVYRYYRKVRAVKAVREISECLKIPFRDPDAREETF